MFEMDYYQLLINTIMFSNNVTSLFNLLNQELFSFNNFSQNSRNSKSENNSFIKNKSNLFSQNKVEGSNNKIDLIKCAIGNDESSENDEINELKKK